MRRFVLAILILIVLGVAAAGVFATDRASVQTALLDGYGARIKAMGGDVVALEDEGHLWFYNPAGAFPANGWRTVGDFVWLDESTQGGFFGLSTPTFQDRLRLSLAGGGAQVRGRIASLDPPIVYSQSQYFGRIGLSADLNRRLTAGLATDVMRRRYHDENVWGAAADVGLLYRIDQLWSVGATWRGLPLSSLEYEGSDAGPPWVWSVGVALNEYRLDPRMKVSAALGLVQVEDDDPAAHLGLEIARTIADDATVSLRAGYNGEGAAAGAGMHWRWLGIDYAWSRLADDDCFDDYAHTISVWVDPVEAIRQALPGNRDAISDYRTERLKYYLEQGHEEMAHGEYLVARERFLQAEAFARTRPQRQEVINALNQVAQELVRLRVYEDSTVWSEARDSIETIGQHWRNLIMEQQAEYEQRLARREQDVIQSIVQRYRTEIPGLIDDGRLYDALGRITFILDHRPEDSQAVAWRQEVTERVGQTRQSGRTTPESPQELLSELDSIFRDRLGIDETASDSLVDVWYQQGINYSREGEYRKAIEQWRKVLQARPEHPTVRQDIEVARRRLKAQTGQESEGGN